MCFSVQVERDLEKLASRFGAKVSQKDYEDFFKLQHKAEEKTPEELKELLGLKRKPSSSPFKSFADDGRVYPGTFAPVIVLEKGERVIKPMRYRVRPNHSSEEVPSKYNVFNARLDSLEKRRTWSPLFLKKHALFPFVSFYEWVEREGKKKLIEFHPKEQKIMWAPALYDHWQSPNGDVEFSSFAIITNEPPPEVEQAGHDRCPIFLKEANIDQWLNTKDLNKEKAYSLLSEKEPAFFESEFPKVKK